MGIYLFMLEVCLENEGYKFDRFIYEDNTCDITKLVCDRLMDTNNKSYIDNCNYYRKVGNQ